jgi:hypothetical protein
VVDYVTRVTYDSGTIQNCAYTRPGHRAGFFRGAWPQAAAARGARLDADVEAIADKVGALAKAGDIAAIGCAWTGCCR